MVAGNKKPRNGRIVGYIFRMYIRHWRTGRIIRRPNGKPFRIPIYADKP
jgi:hypothetical protein